MGEYRLGAARKAELAKEILEALVEDPPKSRPNAPIRTRGDVFKRYHLDVLPACLVSLFLIAVVSS